jgi:hypothetical protein
MRPSRLTTAIRVGDSLRRSRSSMKTKAVQRITRVAIDSNKISGARSSQGTCHYLSAHPWRCSSPREKRQQSQNRAAGVLSERYRRFGLTSLVGMCRLRCSTLLARVGQFDPWPGEIVSIWCVCGLRGRTVLHSRGLQRRLDALPSQCYEASSSISAFVGSIAKKRKPRMKPMAISAAIPST